MAAGGEKGRKEYLLVDGYNIIFAWKELSELAGDNLEAARFRLADILCNYQGYVKNEVILVFDGCRTKGSPGSVIPYHNIMIVYTKEAQTADQYIEAAAHEIGRQYATRVATSDGMEQVIILGSGAVRVSARELKREVERTEKKIREYYEVTHPSGRNFLLDNLPPETARMMEQLRLQEDRSKKS